jgi:L-fucose isomerase-like protein
MSFSYVTIASILHDRIARASIVSSFAGALAGIGGTHAEADAVAALPEGMPLCYFILTGGTEQEALTVRSVRERLVPGEPVWLIAHPLQNSLPASLEILARVKRDGGDGRIFFLADAKDEATLADLERTVSAAAAMRSLAGARLGRVGDSSDWLVASSHGADVVRKGWGVEVVPVSIDTLHRYIAAEGVPESGDEFKFFKEAEAIREPKPVDIGKSVGVYRALRRLVKEEKLDALTLRCFDLVLDEKTTGCFALSRLNDEGVIAGCEGDIPAALALLWAKRLTGLTGWMANPARLDAPAGRLLLAHCTVPRSIVKKYTVRSHFESSLGVGISGEFERGPVTLLRIGGEALDRLWVTEGEIAATSSADGLCRTQIECKVPQAALESMLRDPLGNHIVVVQGHHEQVLREAFRMIRKS